MNKIVSTKKAIELVKNFKLQKKKIVLAGGIFDIIHVGHVRFLEKAKQKGDILFILLESDKKAKIEKGNTRPINNQKTRAEILASLNYLDYVVILNNILSDDNYDKLLREIKPDIIAVTKGSTTFTHAKRQSVKTGAKVIEVIPRINNQSTTKIAEFISKSF